MFCRTLSVLLLGLVFAVKFGSDAYGMYNPGLGRFCSRDPIGYKDGKNLYSNYFQTWGVDPNGTECTSADCIDRCKTLPENVVVGGPGGAIGISHPRQACIDRCKDAEEKFNNWYNEQTKNGKPDYSSLPACPCSIRCSKTSICDLLSGRSAHYVPCSPPGFALVPSVAYPLYLQKYHPGASWDLRSEGSPAQQCTYDSDFNLITSGPCVGTVDNSNAYPPIVGNHRPEDVTPVDWIIELQGSPLAEGCWFNKYLDVRPVNGVKPCKKTSEKHRNRWWDI